ncbi:MAG: hypothetical protein OXR68_03540 [Alphaproteobacteria bacterium]|nr:hypothetical protein [Alphaproteobacteria bacterium]MDD9919680.1 hypothetical protein [Alphaproteobacteria bacterium]
MDLTLLLTEYKAMLSGLVIGCATITGVTLNILYNKRIEHRLKREKQGSTASALAAELLYNSYHLRDLYLTIHQKKAKYYKATEYRHIDTQVYQELLTQIGELGSAITFMIVDTYGDIKKTKGQMEAIAEGSQKAEKPEFIMADIRMVLVKTLSCSLSLYLYSDYMTGEKWLKNISESRIVRIERALSEFCQFMEQIDKTEKTTSNTLERAGISILLETLRKILKVLPKQPTWRAQLTLRAFSYTIQNTLTRFLNIEINEYDLISEQEYSRFL